MKIQLSLISPSRFHPHGPLSTRLGTLRRLADSESLFSLHLLTPHFISSTSSSSRIPACSGDLTLPTTFRNISLSPGDVLQRIFAVTRADVVYWRAMTCYRIFINEWYWNTTRSV